MSISLKKQLLDAKWWIGILLAAGMAWGQTSSRITALEERKDTSTSVAELEVKVSALNDTVKDVKTDVREVKADVKTLLSRPR